MNLATLDRLAKDGLSYTNFHVNPLCSASRVALLTGRNSHGANMGSGSEMATGFPGQNSVLQNSVAPLAKIMRVNGYTQRCSESPTSMCLGRADSRGRLTSGLSIVVEQDHDHIGRPLRSLDFKYWRSLRIARVELGESPGRSAPRLAAQSGQV